MENNKCGTVSIFGRPNVGKSTLLNALVGEKVAIVSNKPQTTRTRITGVLTRGKSQFIFTDTPGLHKAQNGLGDMMVKTVWKTVADADAAVLVAEPDKLPGKPEKLLAERFINNDIPCVLVLNKVDACRKDEILKTIAAYAELGKFASIVPLSAQTDDGIDILLDELEKLLPEGEHIFESDVLTDQPERVLASELVREKLMRKTSQEIPHGITCETERFLERDDGIIEVDVLIICEKPNHKSIIIGKHGAMLKAVGTEARLDIEKMLDAKVFLTLWVKVKGDWKNNPSFLAEIAAQSGQN